MGAAMGFAPQQVDQMGWWQFFAAVDGYVEANSSGEGLSQKEADEIWLWMGERPDKVVKARLN